MLGGQWGGQQVGQQDAAVCREATGGIQPIQQARAVEEHQGGQQARAVEENRGGQQDAAVCLEATGASGGVREARAVEGQQVDEGGCGCGAVGEEKVHVCRREGRREGQQAGGRVREGTCYDYMVLPRTGERVSLTIRRVLRVHKGLRLPGLGGNK